MTRRRKRRWRDARRHPREKQSTARTIASAVLGVALVVLLIWAVRISTARLQTAVASASWLPPCPVEGTPIDFTHKLATVAGPVFFCSGRCTEKYEAYPSKYRKNLNKQREVLAGLPRVQVTCPVSGNVVDAAVSVEHEGKPVYFCHKECLSEFQADPDAYRGKLAAGYWYQTKCPVTGDPVDLRVSTTMAEGERVHFCSEACKATFQRDPASYAGKLAEQGFKIHL